MKSLGCPCEEDADAYCYVGEHNTSSDNMWPDFNDCFDCATAKEYAEQMNISVEEAMKIADGTPNPQVEFVAVIPESKEDDEEPPKVEKVTCTCGKQLKKITAKHLQTKYHIKHSPRPAEQEPNEHDNSTPASTQVESDGDVEQVEQKEDEVKEDDDEFVELCIKCNTSFESYDMDSFCIGGSGFYCPSCSPTGPCEFWDDEDDPCPCCCLPKDAPLERQVVVTTYSVCEVYKVPKGKDIKKAHEHWIKSGESILCVYWTEEDKKNDRVEEFKVVQHWDHHDHPDVPVEIEVDDAINWDVYTSCDEQELEDPTEQDNSTHAFTQVESDEVKEEQVEQKRDESDNTSSENLKLGIPLEYVREENDISPYIEVGDSPLSKYGGTIFLSTTDFKTFGGIRSVDISSGRGSLKLDCHTFADEHLILYIRRDGILFCPDLNCNDPEAKGLPRISVMAWGVGKDYKLVRRDDDSITLEHSREMTCRCDYGDIGEREICVRCKKKTCCSCSSEAQFEIICKQCCEVLLFFFTFFSFV